MCLPQYQLSCNKPWACHPTDNYILIVKMFIMAHYSVGTTVPLFHCIYALHSIKPSSDGHGYSTVSMTVPLSLCVYAHHNIQPSNVSHGHSSVSMTVPLSLCVYAHHSIKPSCDGHGYSTVSMTVPLSLCLCSPQHPAIQRQPWTLLCKYDCPFISVLILTTVSSHPTSAMYAPL